MALSTVAYRKRNNSFETFLRWTDEKKVLGEMIRAKIPVHAQSLLDIGAGNGDLTQYYIGSFKHATLVEPSVSLATLLRNRFPAAHILEQPIEDIPLQEVYDVIVASHVFQYIRQPEHVIKQLVEAKKEHGVFLSIQLDRDCEYIRYIEDFSGIVYSSPNDTITFTWEQLVEELRKYSIPYTKEIVMTHVTAPNVDEFLKLNDFHFNYDVSHLTDSNRGEMKTYLQKNVCSTDPFVISMKHVVICV